jgi:hypothetical protein
VWNAHRVALQLRTADKKASKNVAFNLQTDRSRQLLDAEGPQEEPDKREGHHADHQGVAGGKSDAGPAWQAPEYPHRAVRWTVVGMSAVSKRDVGQQARKACS